MAPAELEGCLLNHPDVRDACVVGIPDDYSKWSTRCRVTHLLTGEQAVKYRWHLWR